MLKKDEENTYIVNIDLYHPIPTSRFRAELKLYAHTKFMYIEVFEKQ